MTELLGKSVEVMANDILYFGILVEVGETDVYLEAQSGWIVIPTDQVAFIREREAPLHHP
ncbi:MAG TPA: hypothetical protein VN328_11065 [Thermodesulfovibrionales bacterium]|nr:hypothetical protein [Thermodesulfovibrionales bacterium]